MQLDYHHKAGNPGDRNLICVQTIATHWPKTNRITQMFII